MTTPHPRRFSVSVTADRPRSVCVRVGGDLDHDSAEILVGTVTAALADHPAAEEIRLDLGGLDACDAMGLSALLMVRRCTSSAGVRLHLDGRSPELERLLRKTGTFQHLTAPGGHAEAPSDGAQPNPRGETDQG
ncbi:STAS domain-containing protein [Streptomyces albidus (ex Kaewkla and Franco 2022)]|uniref:STAS domain-containing protein n=1 Tax=Streptomyces albidus (ex Kaewkla and Franco 2022) TaxID=722709 RepID=UPI0015EE5500|nr:STAS domain-containing protein [Streptomyces albidus (ex Kaewkla and Franco 2022)]